MKRGTCIRSVAVMLLCMALMPTPRATASQADDGSTPPSKGKATAPDAEAVKKYEGPPTWYVQTRVSTDYGIVSTHYWSKGALFRAQTMLAGHPVTTVVDGTHYYVYDEILGWGAAIERNSISVAADATRGRPFGRERDELIAAGGELVRDGEPTEGEIVFDVYQLTNSNGRRRVIVTDSDPPLPVRVETFVRSSGTKGVLEYAGWQRDMDIKDSFFVPPDVVKFERVSYSEYVRRAPTEAIGPAPVYYRDLLHGKRVETP